MRHELENVRAILQKAASSARMYHENIAHVRRTCKPDVILKETETFSKPLKESMEKAKADIREQLGDMEATIKKNSMLDPKNYNKDVVDLIRTMKPGAEELEAIAEQFKGNDTMIRVFHKYCEENQVCAKLPTCSLDKLKNAEMLRNDVEYILDLAGEPTSATNMYGDAQLQHFAENFETVFADRISTIGNFNE